MAGSAASGMTSVKLGLEALQKALPTLPMGSEIHNAVLKAVGDIAKHLDASSGGGPQAVIQQLAQMASAAHADPQRQATLGMLPGGPPPGAGGGAPAPA